jgi:hypothetical protein
MVLCIVKAMFKRARKDGVEDEGEDAGKDT